MNHGGHGGHRARTGVGRVRIQIPEPVRGGALEWLSFRERRRAHRTSAAPFSPAIPASTGGGSRTLKPVRTADFESAAFAIPPLRQSIQFS